MEAKTILEHSALFGALPAGDLEMISALARTRSVAKDTMLFQQGDPGDCLYGLADGKVLISMAGPEGKEFSLTVMETGDVFGEIALLDGQARTATARTLTACELLTIDRAHFMEVLDARPKMATDLLKLLCERIRWSSQLIEEFSLMPVEGRLARRLLTLAELLGRTISEGVRLEISQSELAQFLGISRQIVNQYLQEWRGNEWLELTRGQIIIRNWDAIHGVCFPPS